MNARIQRIAAPVGYVGIDRELFSSLSLQAGGMVMWFLTLPSQEEVAMERLVAAGPDGENVVREIVQELIEQGCLREAVGQDGISTYALITK